MPAKNNEIRIATVKATGCRYIIQRVDFDVDRVHTWGEVTRFSRTSSRHGASKSFALADVTVADAVKTEALVYALGTQALDNMMRRGLLLDVWGGTHRRYEVTGRLSPEAVALAGEMGVDLADATDEEIEALRELSAENTAAKG